MLKVLRKIFNATLPCDWDVSGLELGSGPIQPKLTCTRPVLNSTQARSERITGQADPLPYNYDFTI